MRFNDYMRKKAQCSKRLYLIATPVYISPIPLLFSYPGSEGWAGAEVGSDANALGAAVSVVAHRQVAHRTLARRDFVSVAVSGSFPS